MGALQFLCQKFNVQSMLDIGCGPGGMQQCADQLGIAWQGIDGDASVANQSTLVHDFTQGIVPNLAKFDLAWSVEFLEHVHERHQKNYLDAFSKCKMIACTAAPPRWKGHHHVNCRPRKYWIDVFSRLGFAYDRANTEAMVAASTMKRRKGHSFMTRTGMFFCR